MNMITGDMGTMGVPCPAEPRKMFPSGSSLVVGVTPADNDLVCLFGSEEAMMSFVNKKGRSSPSNGYEKQGRFVCARDGDVNYICTCDVEFFYRFKAYSGVLSLLQEKDKDKRKDLAKACLYWEPKV